MTKDDIILRDLTQEELNRRQPFSHFGWEGDGAFSFLTISDGYWNAARIMLEKMKQNPNDYPLVDSLIYPLFFNYRHSVETILKQMFFTHGEQTDEARKAYLEIGHNLRNLWVTLRKYLNKEKKHLGSKVDMDAVEHYISVINDFDPDSMVMRYPVDKDLTGNKATVHHFDFINFGTCMNNLCDALRQLDCDLSNPMTEQASHDELSEYLDIVDRHRQSINEFMALLVEEAKKENKELEDSCKEDSLEDLFSNESETRGYLESLRTSNPDFLILFDNLFYTGRMVNEKSVRLSKSPVERQKEFVKLANEILSKEGRAFGMNLEGHHINIIGKTASALYLHIVKAIRIIDLADV